jgi:hypothetical protein
VHGWITRLVQQHPEETYGQGFKAVVVAEVVVVSESGARRIKENIGIVGIIGIMRIIGIIGIVKNTI